MCYFTVMYTLYLSAFIHCRNTILWGRSPESLLLLLNSSNEEELMQYLDEYMERYVEENGLEPRWTGCCLFLVPKKNGQMAKTDYIFPILRHLDHFCLEAPSFRSLCIEHRPVL